MQIAVPFNNCITGSAAFSHKAGVHSKAVLQSPGSYEVIDPAHFGVDRRIEVVSRITGWNAVSMRAKELKLDIPDALIKLMTTAVKNMCDEQQLTLEQIDHVLIALSRLPRTSVDDDGGWSATDDPSGALAEAAAEARHAVLRLQETAVRAAVASIPGLDVVDERPSRLVVVEGHLFDSTIVNRLMDICVDSQCEFKVETLGAHLHTTLPTVVIVLTPFWAADIPNSNDLTSTVRIRLWSQEVGFSRNPRQPLR